MKAKFQSKKAKLKEMILLISNLSEKDKYFGATKLNKLLFFTDFEAYLKYGKSISGYKYEARHEGPMIKNFYKIRNEMIENDEIEVKELDFHKYNQHKPLALKSPSTQKFSEEEMNIIMQVISEYKELTASQISALSHEFLGWQAVDIGEEIPYEIALVSTADLTHEEWEFAGDIEIDFRKCGVDPARIVTHDVKNL